MIISHIVAAAENYVIGTGKKMLWHLPKDLQFFMEKTTGHHVLMGRVTFESLPPKFRPLPDRTNIVITRQKNFQPKGTYIFDDIKSGIEFAKMNHEQELFIIGGGEIYKQTLPLVDRVYLTCVHTQLEGEVSYPALNEEEWEIMEMERVDADEKHAYPFTFVTFERLRKSG